MLYTEPLLLLLVNINYMTLPDIETRDRMKIGFVYGMLFPAFFSVSSHLSIIVR
jgi:hypothetical protein